MTWSKENSPPLASNPGKYLTVGNGLIITSVDLTTDTGVYVCSGSNGMKQATDKVECMYSYNQRICEDNYTLMRIVQTFVWNTVANTFKQIRYKISTKLAIYDGTGAGF